MQTAHLRSFVFGLALLGTISAASIAAAKPCGDDTPAGTDTPCDCGDSVESNTVLGASDPVLKGGCFPVGLFVGAGVTLDAHSLNADRLCSDSHPFPPDPGGIITIGLFVVGDGAKIAHGIIRGCDYGIFGGTNNTTIERVTAREGRLGFFIIGDHNTLAHNVCRNNNTLPWNFGGILVDGDDNTLERNYCLLNEHANGITVLGSSNTMSSNRSDRNGGQGVFVTGGSNTTDGHNFGSGNRVKPDCSIDGQSRTPDGRYC